MAYLVPLIGFGIAAYGHLKVAPTPDTRRIVLGTASGATALLLVFTLYWVFATRRAKRVLQDGQPVVATLTKAIEHRGRIRGYSGEYRLGTGGTIYVPVMRAALPPQTTVLVREGRALFRHRVPAMHPLPPLELVAVSRVR